MFQRGLPCSLKGCLYVSEDITMLSKGRTMLSESPTSLLRGPYHAFREYSLKWNALRSEMLSEVKWSYRCKYHGPTIVPFSQKTVDNYQWAMYVMYGSQQSWLMINFDFGHLFRVLRWLQNWHTRWSDELETTFHRFAIIKNIGIDTYHGMHIYIW